MPEVNVPVVSSDSFLHFTGGGLHVLKLILQNGFRLAICDEITGFRNTETNEQMVTAMAVPMICFCDIPPRAIASHAEFYCKNAAEQETKFFGIGMTREWGLRMGLNPVAYTSPSSHSYNISFLEDLTYHHLVDQYRRVDRETHRYPLGQAMSIHNVVVNHQYGVAEFHPRRSLFDKLTTADYYRLDKSQTYDADGNIIPRPFRDYFEIIPNHNFYNEREWRYIPHWLEEIKVFQSTFKNDFLAEAVQREDGVVFNEEFANEAFYGYLSEQRWFQPGFLKYLINDISVIVVNDEDAKQQLIDSIAELTSFGGYDIDHDAIRDLPRLIRTYEELKQLENI